jgi:hypothetical protein
MRGEAEIEPRSSVKCAAAIGVDESSEHAKRLRTTGAILGLLAAEAAIRCQQLIRPASLEPRSVAA